MTQPGIVGILAGAALGSVFGLVQGHLLRGHVQHARVWISANILAWASGIAVLAIGLSTPEGGWPLEATIVVAIFTFILAGLVVAVVTGRFLQYLGPDSAPEPSP